MKIAGVNVNGKVIYVTGHLEPLTGITDGQGIFSHQWRISGDATSGKFKVEVHASTLPQKNSLMPLFQIHLKQKRLYLFHVPFQYFLYIIRFHMIETKQSC